MSYQSKPAWSSRWLRSWLVASACFAFAAGAQAAPMNFSKAFSGGNCGRGRCSWIAANGDITEGTDSLLRDFLRKNSIDPSNEWLTINSPGGNLGGSIQLGETIRILKLNVRVGQTSSYEPEGAGRPFQSSEGGICASACVFALIGGVEREVSDEESKVGVHQFAPVRDQLSSETATAFKTQSLVAALQDYLTRMGVGTNLIGLASAVGPDQIRWLTLKEMEAFHLLTSKAEPAETSWKLQANGRALAAIVIQEQQDGREVGFSLACNTFQALFPMPDTPRSKEVAGSITGASIMDDSGHTIARLNLRSSVHDTDAIILSFAGGADLIPLIASSRTPLTIDIDLPHVYWEDLGVPSFLLPRSNLSEMAYHVKRACD